MGPDMKEPPVRRSLWSLTLLLQCGVKGGRWRRGLNSGACLEAPCHGFLAGGFMAAGGSEEEEEERNLFNLRM